MVKPFLERSQRRSDRRCQALLQKQIVDTAVGATHGEGRTYFLTWKVSRLGRVGWDVGEVFESDSLNGSFASKSPC